MENVEMMMHGKKGMKNSIVIITWATDGIVESQILIKISPSSSDLGYDDWKDNL